MSLLNINKNVSYAVKEMYYTLQGEGAQMGRAAIFLRFSGCNLWSGREQDRKNAICTFCDTDFWGIDGENGGKYSAEELIKKVSSLWPNDGKNKYVVCTGGEPALQLDELLISGFHSEGFKVGIETNGTLEIPQSIDWICVSPKANSEVILTSGNELKLVFPQKENDPKEFEHLEFEHFYIQPMDGPNIEENTKLCLQYCLDHPNWKLSIQSHKYLKIK